MDIINGHRIKYLRNEYVVTQKELAAFLGVSQAFISAIETGTKGIPKNMADQLMREFDLPPSYFTSSVPPAVPVVGCVIALT